MTAGGMSQQLVDFSRVLVGHLRAGLAHASVVAEHGVRRRLGLVDRGRLGDRPAMLVPTMKQSGYKAGLRGGAHRLRRHHRRDHSAEHDDGGVRRHRAGVDRRAVPRRHPPRDPGRPRPDGDGQALHLSPELPRAARGRTAGSRCGRSALRCRTVWPALLAPIVIVGGILGGVFTATEAGVVACLYAFVVGYFFYRKIRLRDLMEHLRRGGDHHDHGFGGDRGLGGDGLAPRLHAVQRHGGDVGHLGVAEPGDGAASYSRW